MPNGHRQLTDEEFFLWENSLPDTLFKQDDNSILDEREYDRRLRHAEWSVNILEQGGASPLQGLNLDIPGLPTGLPETGQERELEEGIPEPPKAEPISGWDSTLLAAVGAVKAIKNVVTSKAIVPTLTGAAAEIAAAPVAAGATTVGGPALGAATLSGAGALGSAAGEAAVMGGEALMGRDVKDVKSRMLEAAAYGAVPDIFRLAKWGVGKVNPFKRREVTALGKIAHELYGDTTKVTQLLESPTLDMLDSMSSRGLVMPGISARHTEQQIGLEHLGAQRVIRGMVKEGEPELAEGAADQALKQTLADQYEEAQGPVRAAFDRFFTQEGIGELRVTTQDAAGGVVELGTVRQLQQQRSELLKAASRTTDPARRRETMLQANTILDHIDSALTPTERQAYASIRDAWRKVEDRYNNDVVQWVRDSLDQGLLEKITLGKLPAVKLRGQKQALNTNQVIKLIYDALPEHDAQLFRAAAGIQLINRSVRPIRGETRIDGQKFWQNIQKMGTQRFNALFGENAKELVQLGRQLGAGQRHLRSPGARVGELFLGLRQTGAALTAGTAIGAVLTGGGVTGAMAAGGGTAVTLLMAPPLMAKVLTSPRFAKLVTKVVKSKTPLSRRRAVRQLNNAWSRWILFDQHMREVDRRDRQQQEYGDRQVNEIARTMFPSAAERIPEPPQAKDTSPEMRP